MPLTRDYQKILVHALVRFGETRDKPNSRDSSFDVVPYALMVLAIIHPIDVMMGEVNPPSFH